MRRALAGVAVAVIALTGCGDSGAESSATDSPGGGESAVSSAPPTETDDQPSAVPSGEPSAVPSEESSDDDGIEIEIEGDQITPNGQRITMKVGATVTLEVESDRVGELHVHSTPEQELGFGKGETELELTIDTPGVVDVEEHDSGIVILQLEVS